MRYRHNFDLGLFQFFCHNDDGTASFYRVDDGVRLVSQIVKPEGRLIRYTWEEMRGENNEYIRVA